jgi:hypothetical protein
VEAREAAHHRRVVGERAIAVQLDEVGEQPLEIVQEVGSLRVPAQLHALPDGQVAVDLPRQLLGALLELLELLVDAPARL